MTQLEEEAAELPSERVCEIEGGIRELSVGEITAVSGASDQSAHRSRYAIASE
jgi:hypothetical protein